MGHTVIIGNGITGITAAITLRKLRPQERITIISGETPYPIARTAFMYVYMGQLRSQHLQTHEPWFWKENQLDLLFARVQKLHPAEKTMALENGETLAYDQLLLATGSVYRTLPCPGIDASGVHGLYSFQDLTQIEEATKGIKSAVLVGGGLIGVELAEMLRCRGISVTMFIREKHYWGSNLPPEEANLITAHLQHQGVQLLFQTQIAEVLSDAAGKVKAVKTTAGQEIPCEFVGLAIGAQPSIELAKEAGLETQMGILVNEFLETSQPGIYAAGDCAQFKNPKTGHPAVEQLWYTGRMQGETVAHTLSGHKTAYERGVWFNSAKFFEVEYQSYGQVPAVIPPDTESLLWQEPKSNRSIRIYFEKETEAVTGFNLLNVRFRQEVCERWIKEKSTLETVLAQLKQAAFDAEFHRLPLSALFTVYNQYRRQPAQ
ncbi:NAD(P)/FAD-dependent oxidoreductase [Rufibacter sp. LB8]|uniref:NAD(P)/FAD-dependent oxidoreductase n=1 Tax=Rufibacter sp. LB8 TaxID=2777781 RepID=UPI00178C57A4|nr:FAD/NAD(P)-binding oxidoreductase [Rufibacter sp. LB8]